MKTRVLVTGGAGYIGSVLVPMLLREGYNVKVIDNFMYSQASLLDCCGNPEFEIIRGDCREEGVLSKHLGKADVILPLAALVGAPLCDSDKVAARTTNLEAILTLLKLKSREQMVVFPCTNSGYGIGEKGIFCTEETPLRPISFYGKLKVEAEKAVLDSGNSISLRLATVFGASPRMRTDLLVNDFVLRAVRDGYLVVFEGNFKRNYVHVRDVARAFIHSIRNFDSMKGEAYNVGLSEANLSKLELCGKIKEMVPDFVYMESEIGEDPDKRDYIVSNEKIERTGFKAKTTLEHGIRELIMAYRILKTKRYCNY